MAELHITRRDGQTYTVLYDDADAERVSAYRWRVSPTRRTDRFYAITNVERDGVKTTLSMHRLLSGVAGADHINHNGLDNRRANLRVATQAQNCANRRPTIHSSRYKGVTWHRGVGRWQASIAKRYLGIFDTQEEAARAYDTAAREMWGDFASLNLEAS